MERIVIHLPCSSSLQPSMCILKVMKTANSKRPAKKKTHTAPAASMRSALIVGKALMAKAKPNKALVAAFKQFPHLIPQ